MIKNVNVWLKGAYADNLKHVYFIITKEKLQKLNSPIKISWMTQNRTVYLQGPGTPNEEMLVQWISHLKNSITFSRAIEKLPQEFRILVAFPIKTELTMATEYFQMALVAKTQPANAGNLRDTFSLWVGKISWRKAWQPTPVFLPGESPWTEEPGRLQSMWSHRVGYDWSHLASTQYLLLN